MSEEKKPKRKYTRRQKPQPMNVYSVIVTVKSGRKTEAIYGESVRTENGCLVVISMDGPPPLVEKTRYIPLGSAEIEVCQRPAPVYREIHDPRQNAWLAPVPPQFSHVPERTEGPQVQPGPLEIARQREAQGFRPVPRQSSSMVERNADGIPVVTAGFLDGSPV